MADEMISLGARMKQIAELKPHAPAVTSGETTLTYAQLHRRTNSIARGLQAHGVKKGDLVTLGLPNSVGFVEAGIVGALLIYGVPHDPAVAVALTDRAITIVTVIVLGGILYAFSGMVRRAHGAGPTPATSPHAGQPITRT